MGEDTDNKRSVLFLTHYFPPEGNAPASRSHETCRRWVEAGHQVTVVTCAPHAPAGRLYPGYRNRLWQEERIDGIRVVRVWTFIAANKGTVRRVLNYLSYMMMATWRSMCLPRPDVVIATSPQFFCGWAGVLVSRLRRRPFLLEIRDIWPDSITAVGALHNRAAIRLIERLERWMYRAASHIVTVGEGYQRCLQERGVPAEKISVITNGINTDLFTPRPRSEELRDRYGLKDKFVCMYVGTIGMAAGLSVVLRAAAALKDGGRDDVRFVLVGDGAERAGLEREAHERGLDNVVFTGTVPKQAVPDHLATADVCLVHLRKTDLFKTVLPSKIFEAAAMQRPIVLGVEGEAARLLTDTDAGLCIEPENERQLIEAVDRLRTDGALYERFARRGRSYMLEHYNRDELTRRFESLMLRVSGEAT